MSADRYLTSPLRALRATFPLDLRGLATLGGIILIGKLAWLVWRGPAYEMDTATYLGQSLTFHHPPIYGWLLRWLEGIWPQAYFVAAVQAVVMAAGLALACAHFGRSPRETRILAILFAIDPITSFFSANLMSEALFIPGTLLWLCLVHQYLREERTDNRRTLVLLIGVWLAAIYSVRLAAIIFPGFFALASLWAPGPKRILRAVLHTIVIFLVLQVMILPMKYAYWKEYNVFGMGNFAGVNLWNSVSVLYPDSSIRDNPRTEFEKFLATRDIAEFSTFNAIESNTIHHPDSAFDNYARAHVRSIQDNLDLSASLEKTSVRLLLENPWGYIERFVIPNVFKTVMIPEVIAISPRVETLMEARMNYNQPDHVRYAPWVWIIWSILAIATTGIQLCIRSRCDRGAQLLLGFFWFYSLVLPVLAAMCLRYALLCAPAILIAAALSVLNSDSRAAHA